MTDPSHAAQTERAWRVENIAKFLAFAIDGHDDSWPHVPPEAEEVYRYHAEGLMLLAEGHGYEAVLCGEAVASDQERS